MTQRRVSTSVADIAVWDSERAGPAVLLIHGNSSCKEIFRSQFESEALAALRLVAVDLPGHGASGDAHDPAAGYTLGGYATMAGEVLDTLGSARRRCWAGRSAAMWRWICSRAGPRSPA
jgi:pimeloyl-ACP methyl ester carboxylesterase